MSAAIDITAIGSWVAVAVSVATLIGMARTSFTAGAKKNTKDLDVLKGKHTELENRVVIIENKLDSMPTQNQVSEINVTLAAFGEQLKAIRENGSKTEKISQELITELRKARMGHNRKR